MTTLREQIATTALTVTKFRDLMSLMRQNRPTDDLEIVKKAYEFSQLHHAGQTTGLRRAVSGSSVCK